MNNPELMQRVYAGVPDMSFRRVVNEYCFNRGVVPFTMHQFKAALINYSYYASKFN